MSFDNKRIFDKVSGLSFRSQHHNVFHIFFFCLKEFMTRVVKEEIQELDDDLDLQERIYAEIRDEISLW